MSTLHPSIVISWAGISDTPRSRIKTVIWHALATPSGVSVTVSVTYRGDHPDASKDLEAHYSSRNAPAWVPRPPEGWLDSLDAMGSSWKYAKDKNLETTEPE